LIRLISEDFMKLAGIVLLGAIPGIAVAYAALTGCILNRVKPAPLVLIPVHGETEPSRQPEAVAA
jgi:hypothetical protein